MRSTHLKLEKICAFVWQIYHIMPFSIFLEIYLIFMKLSPWLSLIFDLEILEFSNFELVALRYKWTLHLNLPKTCFVYVYTMRNDIKIQCLMLFYRSSKFQDKFSLFQIYMLQIKYFWFYFIRNSTVGLITFFHKINSIYNVPVVEKFHLKKKYWKWFCWNSA